MNKSEAWLGKGEKRTSNTKPPKQETLDKWDRWEHARKTGHKLVKNPDTGTITLARP